MSTVVWQLYRLPEDRFDVFESMVAVSGASARKHLKGRWSPVVQRGDYRLQSQRDAVSNMMADRLRYARDLVSVGEDVLLLDADLVFVGPTEVFGRFAEMRMFAPTDPASTDDFDPYMNGGVVYFPASMDMDLWSLVPEDLTVENWGDEQGVYNAMYHAQDPLPAAHPELNWSPHVPSPVLRADAQVVHFHSTRGHAEALDLMREAVA